MSKAPGRDAPDRGPQRVGAPQRDDEPPATGEHITLKRNVQPPPHRRLGPRRMIGMAVAVLIVLGLLVIFF